MEAEALPRKGQEIELTVTTSGFHGKSIARKDGLVFFVSGAVPGDRVRAVVLKRKKNFVEAALTELLEPSQDRIEPRCQHFGICGGCRWQNLSYERQLVEKRRHVQDLMTRIGGLELEVGVPIPSPRPYFYRNKMEFSFGTNRWLSRDEIESGLPLDKGFALGLHVPGRFDKLVDLKECFLQSSLSARIVNRVREIARSQGWSAYNSRAHRGFLKNLVLRSSEATGEILAALVTTRFHEGRMEILGSALADEFKEIVSLVNAVNETRSPVAQGEEKIIYGSGEITETIRDLSFRISLTSFFQPNTLQAERLYFLIQELLEPRGSELLFDIFSGVGCIGLFMASSVKKVVGFENNPGSVENAQENARENGVENIEFQVADATEALSQESLEVFGHPDKVVLDPPRAGLNNRLLGRLLEAQPRRILYVSCNPATQARDIAGLTSRYQVTAVQPLDMFPQTPHIECAVRLDLIEKKVAVPATGS